MKHKLYKDGLNWRWCCGECKGSWVTSIWGNAFWLLEKHVTEYCLERRSQKSLSVT